MADRHPHPVHEAVLRNRMGTVVEYIDDNPSLIHATDHNGFSLLFRAALSGHVEVARYLLDRGADVNSRHPPPNGPTALHAACLLCVHTEERAEEMMALLLSRGADATLCDHIGPPLIYAARAGFVGVLEQLVRHGQSVSVIDATDMYGHTPLAFMCGRKSPRIVRGLLEAGADPTLRDRDGVSAIDEAVRKARDDRELCLSHLQAWGQAYLLTKARCVRDAAAAAVTSANE